MLPGSLEGLRSLLTLVVVLGSKAPPLSRLNTHSATKQHSSAIPANTWILDFWPPKLIVREGTSVVLSYKTYDGLNDPRG